MKISAPKLFERLRLQTQIRRLITEQGEEQAWVIIQAAIETEMKREIHAKKKIPISDSTG